MNKAKAILSAVLKDVFHVVSTAIDIIFYGAVAGIGLTLGVGSAISWIAG